MANPKDIQPPPRRRDLDDNNPHGPLSADDTARWTHPHQLLTSLPLSSHDAPGAASSTSSACGAAQTTRKRGGGGAAAKKDGHAPRPPNAFICYRADKIRQFREEQDPRVQGARQSEISKLIGGMWRNETAEVRKEYEQQAAIKKLEHAELYPDYHFNPIRRGKETSTTSASSSRSSTPNPRPSVLADPPGTSTRPRRRTSPSHRSNLVPSGLTLPYIDTAVSATSDESTGSRSPPHPTTDSPSSEHVPSSYRSEGELDQYSSHRSEYFTRSSSALGGYPAQYAHYADTRAWEEAGGGFEGGEWGDVPQRGGAAMYDEDLAFNVFVDDNRATGSASG
ncbi:hypothetical protein MNV49_007739 [Pseudohyphozyma bogoriensis]|nr:hypothetical protein MNV49_007739 [Pseudohyphozyma bogoriensis]